MPILLTCECGKPFEARDENAGRRFNCPDCGREHIVSAANQDWADDAAPRASLEARTSRKAITSLIFGILSFPLPGLVVTGLPAILFGALGLSDIGKGRGLVRGKGLAISGIVLGSIGSLLTFVVAFALLRPVMEAAREAAQRSQCENNLKQIGIAFHTYETHEGHLPAAFITDRAGNPLLSWRVALLPYLGERGLYGQFKLNEPWDSPTNRALLSKMPGAFHCPGDPPKSSTNTRYQAIIGPNTLFDGPEGLHPEEITDPRNSLFLVVEAKTPIEWTRPDDINVSAVANAIGSPHRDGTNALFADGSVKPIKGATPASVLKALTTRNGEETIDPGSY